MAVAGELGGSWQIPNPKSQLPSKNAIHDFKAEIPIAKPKFQLGLGRFGMWVLGFAGV